jgi:hypothetical protein
MRGPEICIFEKFQLSQIAREIAGGIVCTDSPAKKFRCVGDASLKLGAV